MAGIFGDGTISVARKFGYWGSMLIIQMTALRSISA